MDAVQKLVEALLAADLTEQARGLLLGDATGEVEDRDRRAGVTRRLGRGRLVECGHPSRQASPEHE